MSHSQPEIRCASFCVLLALLAASPVYSDPMFVNIGHSLTLRCHGDPSRDVMWRFKQHEYPDWLDVAVLVTGSFSPGNGFKGRVKSFHLKEPGNYSLLLGPVVYSDLGIYKCQYKNKTILSDVKLEIRVPSNVSVAMGMSASLPCFGKINIQARVVDLDFLWKRGGENVYQLLQNTTTYGPRFENRASVSPEQALYGNMSLTIRQARFSDEGDYQCFYNSPKERGNPDSASLVVTGHPPQNLTVKAGGLLSIPLYTADPVRVTFSALGSDEVMMLDANKGSARYGERCAQRCELLAQNHTLLLRSVTREDAGVYKVTDPETNRTIGSVSLEVSALLAASPVYSDRMFVNIGRSLTLPCHGAPSRDVEWRFQQYEYPDWLVVADLYTGSFSSGNGFQGRVESFYLKDPGNYSLLLSPVVYSDLGIYKCQYKNKTILSDVKLEIRVPSNVSVAMGMSASLPCFAKINTQARADNLDILWKRGGENVYQLLKNTIAYGPGFENRASVSPEQAVYGNMSLTIRQTRFSDEGDYQCFYNSPKERGNPDSASLVVTGHPPQTLTVKAGGLLSIPLYTTDPVRVTFSAGFGSDEVLMLDADNKGPARYGERCAQRCELLAQNYTLLLRSVTLEDAGVYKVTDPETKKTISSVSLEVSALLAASPVYSDHMFVNIGRSLTLPCRGDPSRDVEWRFQQYGYPDWLCVAELYTGSFSAGNGFHGRVESFYLKDPGNYSLLLSPVVYSDLGIYKCQYRDETEIVLSDVKLEIREPSNVSVAMGMSASLPCFGKINMQSRADDLDILWKRGGENVYQLLKNTITYGPGFENRASVSPEQAIYGNLSLTIRQTRFSDEGDYQCFYNSPKERGNPDSASLVVTDHPPQNLTVKAGGLLSIPLYTADPVRVTFSAGLGSDEVLMLDANKGPARYGERCAQRCELLAQDYTLFLRSVTLEDAGVYKVTDPETNKTISSVSLEVSAQLAASPVYSVHMFVNIGRSLTLPCRGAPSRDVEWRFQQYGYPDWLDVADLYTGSFSSGDGFQGRVESFYLKEPGNYSLLLSPVVYSDLGIYKCQYIDGIGIILSDVKLEIGEPSNVSVAMGMSASLPCFGKINMQARADDLDILWKRGGENVYQLLKTTTTYGPRFENRASVSPEQAVYGNMSFTIRQTRFSDEGDYQCFYNSPKERGNPDSASVVVTGHPPQTLTVKAGGLLSIPLYTADPVRVTFSAGLGSDEVLMLDANKGPARYGEPYAQRCELLAQNCTLLLRCVTLEDAGVYNVTDPETKRTIGSVSLEVSGLSAGEVAGIVVGVLVSLLVLVGSAFPVWKFFIKPGNFPNVVRFRAARTEDH
ncbi:uncharacterized protein LOC118218854 isoform X1 [Anguilla anguilla]|uniref:uncharacterized protein LOC118218854 isoform X1 n=1 Tax=Anguilla anguilla TaxID=7936 RepID=UPI0015A9FE15|nr:uncharacterized protein LOC118218854 isoform X1 [Anguilla anguilla]